MNSVLIGVAASRNARFSAFSEALANLNRPPNSQVMFATGVSISANRTLVARRALDEGFDSVLFLDDDMVFTPSLLERLLSHNLSVVSALYVNRTPPYYAVAYNERFVSEDGRLMWRPVSLSDAPADGLAPVVAAGTGGMLIKTHVFEKIDAADHWFDHQETTDDLAFCDRVNAAGFQIWLDIGARMGHITLHEVWPQHDGEWHVGLRVGSGVTMNVKMGD